MGRTVMSCDGGLTWIHDRSDNDDARCWRNGDPNYVECDHTEFSSPNGGLTFGDGRFFASFGWGYNGSVRRSTDGANWDVVKTGGWGGGVAYAKQTLLVVWENGWSTSTDHGATWKPIASTDSDGFDHPFPRSANDQCFVVGREAGAATFGLSSDGGKSWSRPSGLSGSNGYSIAAGNGVIVATGGGNKVTRSTDSGQTWTSKEVLGTDSSWATNLLFDGSVFVAWAEGKKWTSADGESWSSTPFTIDGAAGSIYWGGATAVDPVSKNFVAFLNAWDNYYEKQKAYHSADGISWTTLDTQHFKGGHPLSKIALGRLDAPACP